MTLTAALDAVDADLEGALARLFDLIRIPSISTDPAFADACTDAADWLVDMLTDLGFEASRRDTPGRPIVVAHHKAPGPHYLFYGHYDVQPVDPLDLWHRDPFDPCLVETDKGPVIRARGACDDKGQMMTIIEAMRAYKEAFGTLPGNITLLIEGEEESGSPSIIPFLTENRDELAPDLTFVCDTGMFDADTPAISTMLRGLVGVEFTVHGPDRDLHSGAFGGPAINPIRVLNKILAAMHDETGRVTIPDFYDGVDDTPAALKAAWDGLDFDADDFLGSIGLSRPAGEDGFSVLEQIWARPTAEVNGIWGGYTGAGQKTVLPARASAKVTFRLVGQQDPAAILRNFEQFLRAQLPSDVRLDFHAHEGSPATVMPTERAEFAAAQAALTDEWQREAVFVGCGGSIPIVGLFRKILGSDSVLIGFGNDTDNVHSPNEQYNLRSFHKGIRSWVRVMHGLNGG